MTEPARFPGDALQPFDERDQAVVVITPEQVDLIRRTIAKDATDEELQLFFYDNKRRGVHPLDRLIHFTKRDGRYTPVTSIDYFRSRAAETGDHMGTDDAVFAGTPATPEFSATVTVYRYVHNEPRPFTATARWAEYFPGDRQGFMWKKMPHGQLAKCAEALALRKAFPQQLADLHTTEEMEMEREEPPKTVVVQQPQRKSAPAVTNGKPAPASSPASNGAPVDVEPIGSTRPPEPQLLITKVDVFKGERKPEKPGQPGVPWTLYGCTFSDGREAGTFSKDIGAFAEKAYAEKIPIEVLIEDGSKPGTKKIVELKPAEPRLPMDDGVADAMPTLQR